MAAEAIYTDKREAVSKFLKEADSFIKVKNFEAASELVQQAKAVDPSNPYVLAFIERIEYFKTDITSQPKMGMVNIQNIKEGVIEKLEEPKVITTDNLKDNIEKEFQAKFKDELIKVEKAVAKKLEQEKQRFEQERIKLAHQFEEQVSNTKNKIEQEYRNKLEAELVSTEQRLRDQFLAEQSFLETEMKQRLELEFQSKIEAIQLELENKSKILLENEHNASQEREKELTVQFEERLKTEVGKLKEENDKLKIDTMQMQTEELKQKLTSDFQQQLEKEKNDIKMYYENEKSTLDQHLSAKQRELEEQTQRVLAAELARIREREKNEFAKKQTSLEESIRTELSAHYQNEIELEKQRLHEEFQKSLEIEADKLKNSQVQLVTVENQKVEEIRATLKKEMEAKFIQKLEQIQEQFTRAYDYKMELLGVHIPEQLEDKYALYKKRLKEYWADGQPEVEQIHKLMGLKELLELSFEEHANLEIDVRHELYISKIEEAIKFNRIDPLNTKYLEELKQIYQINSEEASKLEAYILSLFMKISTKGVILVVDDDELLLKTVEHELISRNYKVYTAPSVPDALLILQNNSVDLIISDIKFQNSQMDGFSFFGLIQKHPLLNKIPFVLMSVLGDGGIIRSGLQLGVDDYLTKPLDMDLLFSVVEGKIKRYRSLSSN
ncbi:MAG: response regulator [Bacteroidota bacterium]|nr:response regulator [Bacteroidota bacterium]